MSARSRCFRRERIVVVRARALGARVWRRGGLACAEARVSRRVRVPRGGSLGCARARVCRRGGGESGPVAVAGH